MATTFTSNIFADTYRDDFADSDNFHRILFKAGRGVQARELTQLQTIIQREIARMGNNLFVEGAAINPGGVTVNNSYEFVKLDTTTNTLPADTSTLIDLEFTGGTSGVKAKVIEVVTASGADPATLYVYYTDTSSGTPGTDPIRFTAGEDITNGGTTLTVQTTNTVANPATGKGTRVSIAKGDFYVQEHFVFATAQSIIASKYTSTYTGNIGYKVTEDIVTENDDTSLYDNTGPVPDTTAPGAHRYRIQLSIIDQADVDSDENFVLICRIKNGELKTVVKAEDDYNRINDLLAKRTREESGNYIVRPFFLKFTDNDSDASQLDADVSTGLIYIDGYRIEKGINTEIRVDKPRSTKEIENEVVAANYGNYILVGDSANVVVGDAGAGLPDINTFEKWNLYNAQGAGGSVIGTAHTRAVEEDGANYKLYLFDIKMNSGQNIRSTRSIGTGATDVMNTVLDAGGTTLYNPGTNLLFPLPRTRPYSLNDISLTVQRRFGSVSTDGAGAASINVTAPGETFANTNDWILSGDDSAIASGYSISGAGTTSATISSGPPSISDLEILAYVNKSQGVSRTKTLKNGGITIANADWIDSAGITYARLDATDIYSFDAITKTDSNGANVFNRFRTDNGQRDNFYDLGRVILRAGQIKPNYDIRVQYQYFKHGTSGDFFSVNSYLGQVNYEDIPSHILSDRTVVPLRDVLDFRPVKDVTTRDFTGANAVIHELPQTTDLVTTDVFYYNGRRDVLVMNEQGIISMIKGEEALDAQYPATPAGSLSLYNITYNPYTYDGTDLTLNRFDYRHYTMSSIGKLDDRITRLEETTALSLLELNTSIFKVLDSAGLDRTKSGFFVDNFVDHAFTEWTDSDHRASIDPQAGHMRPAFVERNVRLTYDSAASTNVIKKGDNIYLKYTHRTLIDQNIATATENVNPFATILHQGGVELSPQSDEWRETRYLVPRVLDNRGNIRTLANNQEFLFNNQEWNWAGVEEGDTVTIQDTRRNRVTETHTVNNIVNDRLIETALIPSIRSRKVYFRAVGLRPNTQVFAFFDGVSVADWVRSESFSRISDDPTEYGNRYDNATAHPQGSSTLTTDANGKIEGSFFIPNTNALRFNAGSRTFKLLDITVDNEEASTSLAKTPYYAQGVLDTRQQDITTTRQGKKRDANGNKRIDPLAQSFVVEENNGAFLTKVSLYFNTKAASQPVVVQIRTMENGVPTTIAVPGGTVGLLPASVNTSSDATSATEFEFDEPVYLMGGREYALCVLADTTEYNVFISRMGDFVLGSTEARVVKQPYAGVLFKSANNRTWSAYQTEDLMFKLECADFTNTTGSVILENVGSTRVLLGTDPLSVDSGSNVIRVAHKNPGVFVGDTITISGVDSDLGGISISDINGDKTIVSVDTTGYTFYSRDSAGSLATATDSDFGGGSAVITTQGIPFDIVFPAIQTMVPEGTSIVSTAKFTTGKSLAGAESPYTKDTTYSSIKLNKNNKFTAPRIIADSALELANLGSGVSSSTIKIDFTTTDDYVSPVIDMQRASLVCVGNSIDYQDSVGGTGLNVPIKWIDETKPDGGTHASKHLTKVITLEEGAVGLKVLLAANKPSVAAFDVYYRTATAADTTILDNNWVLAALENNPPSDDNPSVFRDYEYLIGGKGGSLDEFVKFQLKIVMKSSNTSKVPVFKDLRVIAMSV